jgi:hypothetical protein
MAAKGIRCALIHAFAVSRSPRQKDYKCSGVPNYTSDPGESCITRNDCFISVDAKTIHLEFADNLVG